MLDPPWRIGHASAYERCVERYSAKAEVDNRVIAGISLLVVFPFLMAYAAARDLLTMLIPNIVSIVLMAAFGVFALASGMGWSDVAWHSGAAAVTLALSTVTATTTGATSAAHPWVMPANSATTIAAAPRIRM